MLRLQRLSILFAALLAVSGMLPGQSSSGTISGRVVDASGGGVPGAEVRLVNQATKDGRSSLTTASGNFLFTDIQPGTFSIMIAVGCIFSIKSPITSNNSLRGSSRLYFDVREQKPWQGAQPASNAISLVPAASINSSALTSQIPL